MVFIAFICLFLNVNSFLYLSIELLQLDDCISRIYTDNNDTIFEYYNITLPCFFHANDYPNPLVLLLPYEFGQKILFDLYDYGGGEGYFSATVYLNEYIIRPEHQKFWKCVDCGGDNYNYRYNSFYKRFHFYDYDLDNHIVKWNTFFHFYFQVNSLSELDYEGNEIKDKYYSFNSQNYYYISIPNLEDEIDLINFNTTETFYVTNNKTLETYYEERNFRIYFDDLVLFSGKFIGLDESKNDIELLEESTFHVSSNKGLRYKLSESEKSKKGVRLKIKIGTNSISPKDFNFFICLNGYKICDEDQKMKCLNEGFYYDSVNDKYYSCYESWAHVNHLKSQIIQIIISIIVIHVNQIIHII